MTLEARRAILPAVADRRSALDCAPHGAASRRLDVCFESVFEALPVKSYTQLADPPAIGAKSKPVCI